MRTPFFPYVATAGAMQMTAVNENFDLVIGNTPFQLNENAHRQLGLQLKIPAPYYERMRAENPGLLMANVNGWFQQSPDTRRMVRTLDGTARAILSDRYRRIDNYEVAQTVLPIISEMQGARIESCELTDTRMYIKVVNERIQTEVVPGDIVQAGILISNSEVGMGSVSVKPLIYRLVCILMNVVVEPRARVFCALCLYCGLRKEEALGLQWSDIQSSSLTIRRAMTFLNNQQDPVDDLKTKAAHRVVPIPDKLRSVLLDTPHLSRYIVPAADGGDMTRSAFTRLWNSHVAALVPFSLHPHMLRHTYATTLYRAGVDLRTAQKLMGHSSIQVIAAFRSPPIFILIWNKKTRSMSLIN